MDSEFFLALDLIEKEKGISKSYMIEKIRAALVAAVKKDNPAAADGVVVDVDPVKQKLRIYIEKTVVEDYVLTNEYRASIIEGKLKGHPILKRISPAAKIMRATEGVLEHFGERVLSEIIQEYGSYEAFFEQDLGLDAEAISALRDRYLEEL